MIKKGNLSWQDLSKTTMIGLQLAALITNTTTEIICEIIRMESI